MFVLLAIISVFHKISTASFALCSKTNPFLRRISGVFIHKSLSEEICGMASAGSQQMDWQSPFMCDLCSARFVVTAREAGPDLHHPQRCCVIRAGSNTWESPLVFAAARWDFFTLL